MRAAIISTGDELLKGITRETNSSWLTARLTEMGCEVHCTMTVGDGEGPLVEALRLLSGRVDLIVVTGGLGPTGDDCTRAAIARFTGLPLRVHEPWSEELMKRWAKARRTPDSKAAAEQASIPTGAKPIPNEKGSALGFIVEGPPTIAALSGVPHEMKNMFDRHVAPIVEGKVETAAAHTSLLLWDVTESEVDTHLGGLVGKREGNVSVGVTAGDGLVRLHLTVRAENNIEAKQLLRSMIERMENALGDIILGEGTSVHHLLVERLKETGKTLSTAESCTGGLLGGAITSIPGASRIFKGGVVCYSNEAKKKLLGLPEETLQHHGAVSRETATALLDGVIRLFGSHYGMAVTGIAGPSGGSTGKPVGTVYIAVGDARRRLVRRFLFPGDRENVRSRAVNSAAAMLLQFTKEGNDR